MSRHPGIPVERSGSNDFFSDANLNLRATPATPYDFAPGPGEDVSSILGQGRGLAPIVLAEIEVDDGARSADLADDYLAAIPQPFGDAVAPYPPAPANDGRIDRLEAALSRIENLLTGGN